MMVVFVTTLATLKTRAPIAMMIVEVVVLVTDQRIPGVVPAITLVIINLLVIVMQTATVKPHVPVTQDAMDNQQDVLVTMNVMVKAVTVIQFAIKIVVAQVMGVRVIQAVILMMDVAHVIIHVMDMIVVTAMIDVMVKLQDVVVIIAVINLILVTVIVLHILNVHVNQAVMMT